MKRQQVSLDRRMFLSGAMSAAVTLQASQLLADAKTTRANKICAFIKFIQSLSYTELAETIAKLGYDGIEATVRPGGHVLPERVEEDLPKLVEALKKHNLEITVMASNVSRADHPHTEKVLRTAAALGVKRYRMGYYRYDLSKPVIQQLEEVRPALKDLVALNRELGLGAVYQNHSGAHYVGACLWDLHSLIKDYSASDVGVAFDIRHATVEGGLSWPTHFNLMRPHMAAVYAKDFTWDGRRPTNVPLGEGQVDPQFFETLRESKFTGPISLHVEYLPKGGIEKNIDALRTDLKTLRMLLGA